MEKSESTPVFLRSIDWADDPTRACSENLPLKQREKKSSSLAKNSKGIKKIK